MPTGPLGFPRLTDFGPFVTQEKLYHGIDQNLLEPVLENGFVTDEEEFNSLVEEKGSIGSQSRADLTTSGDKAIDQVGRITGNKPDGVRRSESVFFFTTEENVTEYANSRLLENIIVVDRGKIPCTGYSSMIQNALPAFKMLEEGNIPAKYDPSEDELDDEVINELSGYWDTVSEYDGSQTNSLEVFYPCDIPPEAIEGVVQV